MKFNDVNGKKFGLDDSDFKKGITTIEQKLNLLCPNYTLMDHLFGGRQNITPHSLVQNKGIAAMIAKSTLNEEDDESSSSSDDDEGDEDVDDNHFGNVAASAAIIEDVIELPTDDANIISTATIISVPAALDESIISTHVTNSSDKKLKRKRNNKNNNDNNSNNIDAQAEPVPTALSSHDLAKKLLEEKKKQKGSSFAVEFAKSRKMETDLQREQFNWNKKQTTIQLEMQKRELAIKEKNADQELKRTITLQLIQMGMSADAIVNYATTLGLSFAPNNNTHLNLQAPADEDDDVVSVAVEEENDGDDDDDDE